MNNNIASIILLSMVFLLSNCSKEPVPALDKITKPIASIALIADAGPDQLVSLSYNYVLLNGSNSYDPGGHEIHFEWRPLFSTAGLDSLKWPSLSAARAYFSSPGTYYFELKVWNNNGQALDTCKVTVELPPQVGQNEKIFTSLKWYFPWYAVLEVPDIYATVPLGLPMKVFIQREGSTSWVEVKPLVYNPDSIYEYFIETRPGGAGMYKYGSLYIFYYGEDPKDSPSVKVQY